jgi:arsenate reductase (thioredoxin)
MTRTKLLFVCVENSCRSQIAEAFARLHGVNAVDASSAGSRPSGRVNPKAIASMAEIGYDLAAHSSKSVADVKGPVDVVVTMGCGDGCPLVKAARRVDWNIPDPKNMDPAQFNVVRDQIERQVKELLTSLVSKAT